MKAILRRNRIIYNIVILMMLVFMILDLTEDYHAGENIIQLLFEGLIFALAIFGIAILLKKNFVLATEIRGVRSELALTHAEAKKWKEDHQSVIHGLGVAIDQQFSKWHLSASEREIALFLLKGLSFKEIAEIRGTNEKTVRQQSIKVYEKAGLAGRSELSAFFLEDILLPIKSVKP